MCTCHRFLVTNKQILTVYSKRKCQARSWGQHFLYLLQLRSTRGAQPLTVQTLQISRDHKR